ncbi:MAG: hypothetical protein ABGZ17_32185 [Planctomycetaceae bacterium]
MGMPGLAEILLILVLGGLPGGMLGFPPAERDPALIQAAPADSLIYVEWSARSAGKSGAPGIDGLAADPEIQALLKKVIATTQATIDRETENASQQEKILGATLPKIGLTMLNRPGCLFVGFRAPPLPADGEPQPPNIMRMVGGIRLALIVNAGDDSQQFAGALQSLLEIVPDAEADDLDHVAIPLPLPVPGLELQVHRHKQHFILGVGQGTVDVAVAGLDGKTPGLDSNPRFIKAWQRVASPRVASLNWVDLKGARDTAIKLAGPQMGAMVLAMAGIVGADSLDALIGSVAVVEGRIVSQSFLGTGGKTTGILALASGRAVQAADFQDVPADADLIVSWSLNGAKIVSAIRDVIGKVDPGSQAQFEQFLSQFESEIGFGLEQDLFQALDDVWVLQDSPAAGGLFLTSLVGSIGVKDHAKAELAFGRVMKLLEASMPGLQSTGFRRRGETLERETFMGHTIYYINSVGSEFPFAPAVCLTKRHLLVTPHPQAMKAHLRFLNGKQRRAKIDLPRDGDLLVYSRVDTAKAVGLFYTLAPYFGQVMFGELQRDGFDMTVFSLPSARAILPYIEDSEMEIVRTPDGILMRSRSSLPLGSLLPTTLAPVLFLFTARVQGPVPF